MVGFDELHTLCVDVEDCAAGVGAAVCSGDAFGRDVGDGFGGGAVSVAAELGVFEEGALLDEGFELVVADVVVGLAADFAWSWVSCCVYS